MSRSYLVSLLNYVMCHVSTQLQLITVRYNIDYKIYLGYKDTYIPTWTNIAWNSVKKKQKERKNPASPEINCVW